ncbi:MAG TPA: hypothetical protein VMV07_15820 [Streptosporangiaceae bacterium]|nr:hypothetical protein [Streptosporangiaceae bacterium]
MGRPGRANQAGVVGGDDQLGPVTRLQLHEQPGWSALYFLGVGVLYVAPAAIGMFWGAPPWPPPGCSAS